MDVGFILLFAVFFTVGLCTLGDVSTTGKSLFFHVLQTAFVPLAATMLFGVELSKTKKLLLEIAEWLIVATCVFYFIVAGHSMYGLVISQRYTKIFGWTSFINNGYFR